MGLDLSLNVKIANFSLTHNLTAMASHVSVGSIKIYSSATSYEDKELSLYDVLWRPEEHYLYYVEDLLPYYEKGLQELLNDPDKYEKYNPENGWGSYDNLVEQLTKLVYVCKINKNASVNADR